MGIMRNHFHKLVLIKKFENASPPGLYKMIKIKVNFFGILKNYADIEFIELRLEEPATIESALIKLANKINGFEGLYKKRIKEIESDIIIVLNNKEIGVLNGLRTIVKNNDNLFLIPTIHGGLSDLNIK